MDRTSLISKYSRFDTPDIAERIAEKINKYISYDGIEYLHGREIHGRHTVSLIRRGEFGVLPEDYDSLAGPVEPGYYGE